MTASPKKSTAAWLGLGTAAVVLIALTAGLILRLESQSMVNVQHTSGLVISLLDILSYIEDAEVRERGYLQTGEQSYLGPYNRSRKALDVEFDRLRTLTKNNPKERKAVERLHYLVHQKLDELQANIDARAAAGLEAARALELADRGKQLTEAIRQDISGMEKEEQNTLAGFVRKWESRLRTGLAVLVGSSLLALCCLLIGQVWLARSASQRQRAEEALQASKRRFEILCEQAPVGIYEADAQGLCVYTNSRWSEISGLSATESLGHGWARVLHPDDRARVFEGWQTDARQGVSWEYRLMAQNEIRWIHAVGGPIYSAQGELTGYVGTLEDVTERKMAYEALRKALQQLQLITDNMPAAVARCSRDLRYVWVSKSYTAWEGFASPKEMEGRAIRDVVGKEAFDVFRPHIERALSGERDEFEIPVTFLGAGRRWVHAVYVPTNGHDHQVDGWIAVVADVTDRHEAEERLRESEERFRVTFFQAAVGIVQTSIDGQWLLMNDRFCEIFGYSRDELDEKTLIDVTYADDREDLLTGRRRLLTGEISSWLSQKRFIRKDGNIVWARLFVSLVRDQQSQPRYFVSVVEDITTEMQAERALQQSRQELRALAGRLINAEEEERKRISRELHDDLSQKLALLAFDTGSLLLAPLHSVDEMKEPLRNLQTRVVQLSEDVRQISHQLHPAILEDLGITAALSELCEEFPARERIEVLFEPEAVPKALPLDVASCLYRVAQEAFHNVAKHAQASQVRLTVGGNTEGIHLSIHDNGVGFDSEALQSRPGLGIVSMKERVSLVQGEFSIQSQPGQGTEVAVFVPLSKKIKKKRQRVLVADDCA